MRLSSLLPYRAQLAIGRLIGRLAHRFVGKRRHIAQCNIALCFPDLDQDAQNRLAKKHLESVGIGLMEMSLAWWGSEKRLASLTHIEGFEHAQAAIDAGQGIVLLAGHFTTIEIGGVLLTRHLQFDAMYRKFENPLFEEIMRRKRERWARRVIKRGDFRQMLRSLKEGRAVLYMPDQAYVRQNSLLVPFFGHPAPTSSGTERLVKNTGAVVIPFLPLRNADGSGYTLKIYPPLDNFPEPESIANATRLNKIFEEHARQAPEQYLWIHRRFKDQPGVYDAERPSK